MKAWSGLLVLLAMGCAEQEPEPDVAPDPQPLNLTATDSPIPITGASFYEDVAYDTEERTHFDLFIPDGDGPFPLLLEIHGGGFTAGTEDAIYEWEGASEYFQSFIDAGIAVANVEYRLLDAGGGVRLSMMDSTRALQFLRWHSAELRLDPETVAATGNSAGAGTALWMATHDDMALITGDDWIARQSTRISAANGFETQATYDIVRWETDIYTDYGITLELAEDYGFAQTLLDFYAVTTIPELYEEPVISYRADVDMMALASPDDPPMRVQNIYAPDGFPFDGYNILHHPRHALFFRDAALENGADVVADVPVLDVDDDGDTTDVQWLIEQLTQ